MFLLIHIHLCKIIVYAFMLVLPLKNKVFAINKRFIILQIVQI